jgi:hypothetical protein
VGREVLEGVEVALEEVVVEQQVVSDVLVGTVPGLAGQVVAHRDAQLS